VPQPTTLPRAPEEFCSHTIYYPITDILRLICNYGAHFDLLLLALEEDGDLEENVGVTQCTERLIFLVLFSGIG
jgi:hypothetical protein